ncbi:MAG: exodeoxyribonuclease III [Bryobacter sp.]|nr:exodeoxyribonuclease III [Bryobacter sp.]
MPQGKKLARLATWNVNGIRAAAKAGFADWARGSGADVILLQEVRAEEAQLPEDVKALGNYHAVWFPASVKKGYSGTAILSKEAPKRVWRGLGYEEFDGEGRFLAAEFADMVAASAYFPNSQDGGKRLDYKLRFCDAAGEWLSKLAKKAKPVVLGGDYNIAPYEIDLARPKDNHNTPGFLPEERAWMDGFLRAGWTDAWRHLNPETVKYSWWSARTGARAKNIGWRIDFHTLPKKHADRLVAAAMHNDILGSDHCPVTVDLALD